MHERFEYRLRVGIGEDPQNPLYAPLSDAQLEALGFELRDKERRYWYHNLLGDLRGSPSLCDVFERLWAIGHYDGRQAAQQEMREALGLAR